MGAEALGGRANRADARLGRIARAGAAYALHRLWAGSGVPGLRDDSRGLPELRSAARPVPCDLLPPYIVIGLAVTGVVMAFADRGAAQGKGLGYAASLEIFIPVAIIFSLALLRPIKGLVLAYVLKLSIISLP